MTTSLTGFLSAADLDAIATRAYACDDVLRQKKGQWPRRTRCSQCATILMLVAHIRLTLQPEAAS